MNKEMSNKVQRVKQMFKMKNEWLRYVKCENKYNVEKVKYLNLMLLLLKEKRIESDRDLDELLEMISYYEELLDELEEKILELKTANQNYHLVLEEYIAKIMSEIKLKIHQICSYVSQ
jgi:hypothetical protein